MEEIKVGEYVRLDRNQGINKIIDLDDDYYYVLDNEIADEWGDITCVLRKEELDKDITKHSPNIIDLIEVGDYVNGEEVTSIYDENKEDEIIQLEFNNCGNYIYFTNNDVKNIVTHESFNSIKYEVI